MKAFAYFRCSGLGQVEGDSFPRQQEAIARYAAAHDMEIVETFRDAGVSGTVAGEDRPGWAALLVALEANGVRTVVVEKLDRLARDVMVQEAMIRDLMAKHFELVSTMEPDLSSNEPTRVFIRTVFGALAAYDRAITVQKLKVARQRIRQNGKRCEGRLRYGSKPGEADPLKWMKRWATDGTPPGQIAEGLNHLGIKTRYGKPWLASTVSRILKREAKS